MWAWSFFTSSSGHVGKGSRVGPRLCDASWREDLDRKGEGVHHIAFQVKGMKEKLAALDAEGMPLLQKGEYTGGRYAYVDAVKDLKVIIELLEND